MLTLRRRKIGCVFSLLLLALIASADARTRHHRRHDAFTVALQPFLLARSAVHALAEPIVYDAPRVAYRSSAQIPRGEMVDEENDSDADADQPRALSNVRMAESANYARPVHLAYMVPRAQSVDAPTEDNDPDEAAQEQEREAAPNIESSRSHPMVAGSRAVLRNGVAYAPANAPQSVKNAIWAANSLRHKPYIWGGGHGSFADRGYDCSGTVSFALHSAGAIGSPMPSSDLMRFGERGRGRWFTIYSRSGHTYAVIASLRLDTTDFESGGNVGPRWHTDMRDTGGYVARHPAGM